MNAAVLASGYGKAAGAEAPARRLRFLAARLASGALQPVPAHAARRAARALDARQLADVRRDGPDVAGGLALQPQPGRREPAHRHPRRGDRLRAASPRARSSSSSPRPTCAPAAAGCSATTRSRRDVLLASACLPTMFQAVEIDGEDYWDGGYSGNPTMTPLIRECDRGGHHPGADQPHRAAGHAAHGARHPQSPQRGLLQRRAAEGAAHDGAAAPQVAKPDSEEGAALGAHAHPPHQPATPWSSSATRRSSTPSGSS